MEKNHLLSEAVMAEMLEASAGQKSLFQELAEANARGQVISEMARAKYIYEGGKLRALVFESCKINTFK